MTNQTIIVDGKKIHFIQSGYTTPGPDVEVIDLKDLTVMPGFMDMHVHIEGQSSPKRYELGFRMNRADVALQATVYCERTLMLDLQR